MSTEAELQHQNERYELLLNLTSRITSSLDLREVLRAIAANIREVIHADAVTVALPDPPSEKFKVFAMDFPHSKGVIKEELLVTPSAAVKEAIESLKPVLFDTRNRDELEPDPYGLAAAEGLKAACNIPLVNRGRALGILSILRTTETPFTSEDVDFLNRASGPIAIAVENALAYREISELKDKLAQEKVYLEEEFRSEMGFEQIIGNSAALRHVLQQVETVAPSDSTVLILGETGTGKELVANAVHQRSRRRDKPLIRVNCTSIPRELFESEFFGHSKGAFTGAIKDRTGRFEAAAGGTLFLDEIGDIPLELQSKLLRVLQEKSYERIGEEKTRRADVRIVAATNRDLKKEVAAGRFREDFYYRLNVFPLRVAALRERKEDIPLLAAHFVELLVKELGFPKPRLTRAGIEALQGYDWPGNIRELRNVVEAPLLFAQGGALDFDLPVSGVDLTSLGSQHPDQAELEYLTEPEM